MRKPKPLPYKRGDQVIFIIIGTYGMSLSQGEVTAVRNDEVVYVKHVAAGGSTWKYTFGRVPGHFQEKPRPLWMLRHLNGENFKALEKRVHEADRVYKAYCEALNKMERELEHDAYVWKNEQREVRKKAIPNGQDHLYRVVSRMGFKRPKNQFCVFRF